MPFTFSLHPDFRLNGIPHTVESLSVLADELMIAKHSYEKELGTFLNVWLSSKDSIILNTSGSTGKPKTINASKRMLCASAQATINVCELLPTECALLCLPIKLIAGKMMMIRAFIAGLWIDVNKPTSFPLKADKYYDFTALTPYQLSNSLVDIHKVKQILVGGAPVNDQIRNSVKGHTTKVLVTYGMTETYSHVALQNISESEDCFSALNGIRFSNDDDTLVIHASYIGIDKLKTNDCVELLSSTKFKWKGRKDNVVNSGGIKLHPEQIEKSLASIIDVPFFVFGKKDQALGSVLAIVFEGEISTDILERIEKSKILTKYEKPKEYFVVSNFVYSNEKIIREQTILKIKPIFS